jgi:hypothetical protein
MWNYHIYVNIIHMAYSFMYITKRGVQIIHTIFMIIDKEREVTLVQVVCRLIFSLFNTIFFK